MTLMGTLMGHLSLIFDTKMSENELWFEVLEKFGFVFAYC